MTRVGLAIVGLVLAGCAPVTINPGLVTDSPDFMVEASPATGKRGPSVEGYVYNKRPLLATRVRLRIEALDAAGAVVATAVRPLDRDIPIGDRVYFDMPVPAAAPAYRVTVDYVFWRSGAGGSGP